MAAWTYEALHRREQTLNFLASLPPALVHSVAEELTDYPEMAELRRNPRFLKLLESNVP